RAVGMPELVASSLAEYEAMALSLARDPEAMARARTKLETNRSTEPLFNTARITRNLETAYMAMCERTRRGEPPESFVVTDAAELEPHDPSTDGQGSVTESPASFDPLATPDFFPMQFDAQRNSILFVQMSRQSFKQSVFLDRRAVRAGTTTLSTEIPKLMGRQAERPMHFILHGAFCGSTLLARYLETLPNCLVLKEPSVLFQLSRLPDSSPAEAEPSPWYDRLRVTLALLARGYPGDRAVSIKASDRCSWMGNLLLDHDASTKVIFVSAPLKVFLLQVLKEDERRQFVRARVEQLGGAMAQVLFLSGIEVTDLTDGQRAAALWLLNSFLCRSLQTRPDSHRILVLNGEDLISRPEDTVLEAAEFFGLADDEGSRAALETLQPASHHAKHGQLPYDASARETDLTRAETRYGDEVGAALSWASMVASGWLAQSPFPVC
ncbi:MAG: hypothetical protein WAN81_24935, partial [Candidatus Binataceae bacterium]